MFFRVKTLRGSGVIEALGRTAESAVEAAVLKEATWFGATFKYASAYQGVNVFSTSAPNVYEFMAWSNQTGVPSFSGFCYVEQVG